LWSYYGTKKRLAKYYPKPNYDIIIEPFCGAAQYSLYNNNWEKEIYLIDKYQVIIDIWKYLINVTSKEILSLPDMYENDSLDNYGQLSIEEKYLIGFCINNGSAQPKRKVQKFNNWNKTKIDIANNLYKIKHWKVKCDDYQNIKNINATWFIDPPYQFGGEWLRISNKNINYNNLANWCKSRHGQIIVCENTKANWLDFKPLIELKGQLHTTTEAIWLQ